MGDGKLVHSRILEKPSDDDLPQECEGTLPAGALIVEHAAIPFRNYPYEWAPEMLRAAAVLTIDLAREAMRAGYVLKDATPYNVMYDGARPVFIDLLSFRRRDPKESIWQPYAQFVRTFVLPLLAYRHFGVRPDELLLTHRDGIEPERLMRLCPSYRLLFPPFLSVVTLPALLSPKGRKESAVHIRQARDAEEATFLLESLFRRSSRLLGPPGKPHKGNTSVDYMDGGHPYESRDFDIKERFVSSALSRSNARMVLDVGCNTGHFSQLAARTGARVVAIDRDEGVIDNLWRSVGPTSGILPLVVDIGRPPGGCGWQNHECASFLDRARGRFDCVFMLALLHHLLVNERVPMTAILDLAAELTTDWAVIEYVDPQDPNFRHIARGRDALHRDITPASFEAAARRRFQIVDAADVNLTRRIYLLRKG